MLPTGDMELVAIGDTVADIVLPAGFNTVSLNITAIDGFIRIFFITLSLSTASLLNGGEIRCDDTTQTNIVMAGCPLASKLIPT